MSYTNDGLYLHRLSDAVAFDGTMEPDWRKELSELLTKAGRMLLDYRTYKKDDKDAPGEIQSEGSGPTVTVTPPADGEGTG